MQLIAPFTEFTTQWTQATMDTWGINSILVYRDGELQSGRLHSYSESQGDMNMFPLHYTQVPVCIARP